MILNLSKKTIISSNPIYRTSNLFGLGLSFRNCLYKNDSIVFQNCGVLCGVFLSGNADILFINSDNAISRIEALGNGVFLKAKKSRTIVLLQKGNVTLTDTEVGDILDLNAELTTAQKKSFLKVSELALPVPGAVISKSQNANAESYNYWR